MIISLLFILFGALSAFVLFSLDDLFIFGGVVYGLATVAFLPILHKKSMSYIRNILLRSVWITGSGLSFYLAIMTFVLFNSNVYQDETVSFMLAGAVGSLLLVVAYTIMAYFTNQKLNWLLVILVIVTASVVPVIVMWSGIEKEYLYVTWQFFVTLLLALMVRK